MKLKQFKFLIPILVIIFLATAGYMLIYAHNPFMELVSVFKTVAMGQIIVGKQAPDFVGISNWFNTDGPISINDLKGKVVLVDFWTYSCINCERDTPYINQWYEKYHSMGLEVIGIHTPEFRFEEKLKNVEKAVEDFQIKFPVGMDNDYKTWRAYQNHYWPAKYLINTKGEVVYYRFGEGDYENTEQKIQELLAEIESIK